MAKLHISLPTGDIAQELTGEVVTIGRTPDNTIQINHHSVSAHHAKLQLVNGKYKFKDLDSTNRSCINNIPISEAELSGSCFLRLGTIECVYRADASTTVDPVHSQLAELQRQMENLMKARDQISQQNSALRQECDKAKHEADVAKEALADLQKSGGTPTFQPSSLQPTGPLNVPAVRKGNGDTEKRIMQLTQERDSLVAANQELKAQVETLTAQLEEARHSATVPAMPPQQKAAEHVKEEMEESVDNFDETEMVQEMVQEVAQMATAGSAQGRPSTSKPLFSSWLNRGSKSASPAPQPAAPNNITSMPSQRAVPAPRMPVPGAQPTPASPPALRIIPPPSTNGQPVPTGTGNILHRAGAAAAAATIPQNPAIRPTWDVLNAMRRSLHYFLRHQDEVKVLEDLEKNACSLTEMAKSEVLMPIHELTTALEALVRDQRKSPQNITPSSLRTIGQCIDFLALLINESNLSRLKDVSGSKIFAIDDDQGILDIITSTMEMAHLNITTAADATDGLAKLSEGNYEMILLDVGLPDMNGMDICSRVRAMSHHHKTPIVFLTGEATVQNRVQSTLNGGNDMIGKPFSVLELAVKALTWIFKGQLGLV